MAQNVATLNPPSRSVTVDMATRFGMEPQAFEQTLRATVVPGNCSKEQFAAFLLVAREYELNPLTKEIYAFPAKGGGIQPIVSIDGWCNLINSHPQLDGIEFDDRLEGGKVTSITARLWRKDRQKPIVVTEYLAECQRQTDPWKQYPRRMLRHKALIQCARYAFGFAGIVDPDEAERLGADVSAMRDVNRDLPPEPPAPPMIESKPQERPADPGDIPAVMDRRPKAQAAHVMPDPEQDPQGWLEWLDTVKLRSLNAGDDLETVWNEAIAPMVDMLGPTFEEDALAIYRRHEARIAP